MGASSGLFMIDNVIYKEHTSDWWRHVHKTIALVLVLELSTVLIISRLFYGQDVLE